MLAVPFLVGALVGGVDRLQVPLFVAWIAGYLLSYYAFQTLRVRRRRSRYAEQLAVYGTVATACAVVVLIARPEVMWLALAYAPLLAVNAVYAYRRDDRALVNDLSSVVQACAMAPVAYWVGGGESGGTAAALFAVTALYFTGTVFYVKTMIRERGDAVFYRVSVGYHVLALAAAAVLDAWLLAPFAVYLARAALLPSRGWKPKQVGVLEMGNCALLVVVTALTL